MTSAWDAKFDENGTGIAFTATASDADAGSKLTYALGGDDAALFTIEAATGAVRFITAPDFETPTDAGKNNVYELNVTANDGVNYSTPQYVQVTVKDVVVELVGVVI